jgi:hypothetical protein
MRLPRLTTRRLMALVAVVALLGWAGNWAGKMSSLSSAYRHRARVYAFRALGLRGIYSSNRPYPPPSKRELWLAGIVSSFPEIGPVKPSCELSLETRSVVVGYGSIRPRSVTSQAYWSEG